MGNVMEFSLTDYKTMQSNNELFFPKNYLPFAVIDKKKYRILENEHTNSKGLTIEDTFKELQKRTGKEYFRKIYPAQSAALNFSESSFPPYRFLMPDVLTDDWLAIVDFHKNFSRDHALHQPLTAYIVFKLLGGGISGKSFSINGEPLLDLCVKQILDSPKAVYIKEYLRKLDPDSQLLDSNNPLLKELWKSLFYETAMVSAIFHDIGYPWQYINRLNNSIKSSDFNLKHLPSSAQYIKDVFKNRLIMYPFHGYKSPIHNSPYGWEDKLHKLISNSLSTTHGFPGALGFLYLNDIVRKYPCSQNSSLQYFCIEWAALGIMMHDMKGIYWGKPMEDHPKNDFLRLSFDTDPLSCIIALADVMQDFQRPMVKFNTNESGSEFKYEFSCDSTSIEIVGSDLEITYQFATETYRVTNIKFKKDEEKEYFDTHHGYINLSSIGINKIKLVCGSLVP